MRKATEIKDEKLINEWLSLTEDDCLTLSKMIDLLGDFGNGERCKPYDYFQVPANTYGNNKKNKNPFYTTVGLWIFNKAFIEQDLFDLFHYIDEPISKKIHGKINNELSYAVLEDKISLDVLKRFEMKVQKFMPLVSVLSASYTDKMLTITGDINKKKKELLKKYDDGIKKQDPKVMSQIESELLDYAKEILKDDKDYKKIRKNLLEKIDNLDKDELLTIRTLVTEYTTNRDIPSQVGNIAQFLTETQVGDVEIKDTSLYNMQMDDEAKGKGKAKIYYINGNKN